MTETVTGGAPAFDISQAYIDYAAKAAARTARAKQLRPINKAALFDALVAAGVTSVVVAFDGYGDSGQIESVDARRGDAETRLPAVDIEIVSPTHDGADVDRRTMPLAEAIETLAYDLLEETHAGWENNDGAYGEFAFDVAARTITLDHTSRYTAVESFSYEW